MKHTPCKCFLSTNNCFLISSIFYHSSNTGNFQGQGVVGISISCLLIQPSLQKLRNRLEKKNGVCYDRVSVRKKVNPFFKTDESLEPTDNKTCVYFQEMYSKSVSKEVFFNLEICCLVILAACYI